MLFLLSREAINAIFSEVSVPATIILFIAVLVSTFNIYISYFLFPTIGPYYRL